MKLFHKNPEDSTAPAPKKAHPVRNTLIFMVLALSAIYLFSNAFAAEDRKRAAAETTDAEINWAVEPSINESEKPFTTDFTETTESKKPVADPNHVFTVTAEPWTAEDQWHIVAVCLSFEEAQKAGLELEGEQTLKIVEGTFSQLMMGQGKLEFQGLEKWLDVTGIEVEQWEPVEVYVLLQ